MQAHVRILVEVNGKESVVNGSKGHYDLQIDDENVRFDQYISRTFDYPVFSYGPDASGTNQAALTVFDKADSANHYAGKKYWVWSDDFTVTTDDVKNFHEKILKTIDISDGSNKKYLADKNAWAYKVTNEDFDTYNVKTSNCFMAVAKWAEWLGYNKPKEILEDAKGNNEKYFASVLFDEYKQYWTEVGYIGI